MYFGRKNRMIIYLIFFRISYFSIYCGEKRGNIKIFVYYWMNKCYDQLRYWRLGY